MRTTLLVLTVVLVTVGSVWASQPASAPAAGAGGAEAYAQWLLGARQGLEADLPKMAASADAAAKVYLQDGAGIAAHGDIGFTKEINNRAGGIIRMQYAEKVPADFKGVVLAVIRENTLDQDVEATTKFHKRGCYVVAFAGARLLDQARQKGAEFDSAVDTHAAENDGLSQVTGVAGEDQRTVAESWVVATAPTASILAAWTWQAEFVAACTRLGKMPPMFQSYAIPGSKERAAKLKELKFHDTCPPAVPGGTLGKAYLQAVAASYQDVSKDDLQHIRDLAALVASTRQAGKKVYFFAQNHAQLGAMSRPHEGGYFEGLNANGYGMKKDAAIGPGDLVFVCGYDQPPAGKNFATFQQETEAKGAVLAWTFAVRDMATSAPRPPGKDALASVQPGQIVIDQHWSPGDAAVDLGGYDIKILPVSGVLAEAVLGTVNAEVHWQSVRR